MIPVLSRLKMYNLFRISYFFYDKVECFVPIVIWSEFHMGRHRDDDHREHAPHFSKKWFGVIWDYSKWWIKDYFREEEKEAKEDKPDMTDFETFSNNFDKIEKQHRKAGKAMVKGGVSLKLNLFYNQTACIETVCFSYFIYVKQHEIETEKMYPLLERNF